MTAMVFFYPSPLSTTLCLLAAAIGVGPMNCDAQSNFPSKPLHFIAMGAGFPENTARIIGNEIAQITKQVVVVESKPGANGIMAAEFVAKAPADGYTLLVGTNSTHAANPSLYKKLPYDYVKDFSPVSGISQGMMLLLVHPRVPVKTLKDLTALALKHPDELTFGSGSSVALIGVEYYKLIMGLKIRNVPYKTAPQSITDLVSGRIDIVMSNLGSAMPQVEANKLRALAVSGSQRWISIPQIPTMKESGVKDYEWSFWIATWLPAGAPSAVVSKLNELIHSALIKSKTKDYLLNAGSTAFANTAEELMAYQIKEHDKWRKVILAAKVSEE